MGLKPTHCNFDFMGPLALWWVKAATLSVYCKNLSNSAGEQTEDNNFPEERAVQKLNLKFKIICSYPGECVCVMSHYSPDV